MNKPLAMMAISMVATALSAQIGIKGELPHEYTANPGQRIEGTVIVGNLGNGTATAKVYVTDYRAIADGTSYYDPPGTQSRSCAPWFQFSPQALAIPRGEQALVSFSISVPADNGLYGTYWCMLMIEEAIDPAIDAKTGIKVNQNIRYGLQMAVHIGATGVASLKLQNPQASRKDKETVFSVDAYNNGDRMLKPVPSLELFDENGKSAGKFTSTLTRVYPGSAYRYRFSIPADLPRKKYKAVIVLDCGENQVFAANLNLSLE
jgi:uncharacterized repeat protein (TIGR01451 family)